MEAYSNPLLEQAVALGVACFTLSQPALGSVLSLLIFSV